MKQGERIPQKLINRQFLLFFIVICAVFAAANVQGQEKDREKELARDKEVVMETVKLYLRVTDFKDSTAIAKAFHPEAKLLSVKKSGELRQMSLAEWWQRVSRIPNPKPRKCTMTLLDLQGLAAAVKVEFEGSTDYLLLLKCGEEWKIVQKTLSVTL